ncbi:hypothetical protein N9R54_01605 [Pelobium sp.]|nr:hypothetical protein [Pelobium sp.]MDA9554907.1 hypothetical protein [Pelobium sp.]
MKKLINGALLCGSLILMMACGNDKKPQENKVKKVVMELPAPFRRHEKIEVGPELIFDVYTWGRGSDSTSSILILRSDSLKNDFTVASTDNLKGRLVDVFNTDMDTDGNPEVLIYYTLNDKFETAKVLCYEFNGKNVNQIKFPDLSSKTKVQYRGLDKFYVKDAKLIREFNLYDEADTAGKNPTGKKKVEYFIKNNSFDLTEIE